MSFTNDYILRFVFRVNLGKDHFPVLNIRYTYLMFMLRKTSFLVSWESVFLG